MTAELEKVREAIGGALAEWVYSGDPLESPVGIDLVLAAIEAAGAKVVWDKPVGYIIGGYLGERREEYERNGTVMYAQPSGMATVPLYAAPSLTGEKDV